MAVLFAPILRTTQPAFAVSQDSLTVYYTLPQAASLTDVTNIEVKVNTQDTNSNIVNNSTGILSLSATMDSFNISKGDLKAGHWAAGKLYKIQARLANSSGQKSEWSNVMITKAITPPQLTITNGEVVESSINEISAVHTELVTMPTFYGKVEFSAGEAEYLDTYCFNLYKDDKLVESSGNVQYNGATEALPQYRFKQQLIKYETYSVVLSIVSTNGYVAESKSYDFEVASNELGELTDLSIEVDSTSPICIENAMIQVRLNSNQAISGNYVIIRSDETTNYQIWEDMVYLTYAEKQLVDELVLTDYFIECGRHYKYAVQRNQSTGTRSKLLLPTDSSPHCVNFEYSYLCSKGKQIKLNFNNSIANFKHTQLVGKLDTIGSIYPTIVHNGHAYYAEFSLSALVSAYMDEENLFMEKDFEILSTNPTADTVRIEREFRHKVETFLNDKEYKLFKTPTESNQNLVVALVGATLTPQNSLNRMIYSFSATAYEVVENTLSNLKELGIMQTSEWEDISKLSAQADRGQIVGTFTPSEELFDKIREQQETTVGDYKYKITTLRTLKLANDGDTPNIITFLLNGVEINVAKGKEYSIVNLENSGITSIKLKSTATIQLDYSVEKTLEEITEPIIRALYIERDWGQVNHKSESIPNQSVTEMITQDVIKRISNIYNGGVLLQQQSDGSYVTIDKKLEFRVEGIETICLQDAEGVVLSIDGRNIYIGSTSQYRLQPVKDKLKEIILVEDKPLLINYKIRLIKRILQGGN